MSELRTLGVIPARYQSSRLPGKPLEMIGQKTLLEHVWQRTTKARMLQRVVIATDDSRIYEAARSFGAEAMMTSESHQSGTDRAAEVVDTLASQGENFALVANIQGDMPFINPKVIDSAVEALADAGTQVGMGSVCIPILSEGDFLRPSVVKVVMDEQRNALYFSRSPIPYWRERDVSAVTEDSPFGYKHIGLYVFKRATLKKLTSLGQSDLETRESLEQLRALSNGVGIRMAIIPQSMMEASIEVDTPADLQRARDATIRQRATTEN